MTDNPKRRKSDQIVLQAMDWAKGLIVLGILVWSMWGHSTNFDETEGRVIRDVALAIILGTGVQKGMEKWISSR